jgi:hypothetical protein
MGENTWEKHMFIMFVIMELFGGKRGKGEVKSDGMMGKSY